MSNILIGLAVWPICNINSLASPAPAARYTVHVLSYTVRPIYCIDKILIFFVSNDFHHLSVYPFIVCFENTC
ncbi:hypothetical protein GLOIN_2v1518493 [Rhizophagus irregularis DAOM 181602=DAOM 197198]|uniref:Uncharacterized protein n=1 Tax=Rhizophagus irregularis (strain DAOM 181602 / DAOM 197198 / MUCL 43194) TaxID=747089 RepID=A0A2P4QSA2_RHIID|nr:hypothetical protein GLOIN_2v1518493 [Rhizophagus irregularis DAOM 181602=DAOM 197198]POG80438.1 hypothetical protein GLOIN_2v1518493 [Rhizophagus irregularis DAOM 181602=DAOM 197198]GET50205.1 hypothetical protein GLOIN_2v1518493 [Rhizophagus irregularis DAOM 181602=DAOM 197198]|eukprot:XP_025187304.1 hypothetical protein GLOIN_2v1518493 [Rhizophagus irregularis DAOM 181602=DAOM 197198]